MSLEYQPIGPVPTETARVAKAAFAKGNSYLTLRDNLGPVFSDLHALTGNTYWGWN